MTDPIQDEEPPPGHPQTAREEGIPDWVYAELAPYYNESMLARKMYVIATYAYRYRHRHGWWPDRTELGHAVKRWVKTRDELDELLALLDSTLHPVYEYRISKTRGPAARHYGFTSHLYAVFEAPKQVIGRRISE